jgi:endonuclease III
VKSLKSLPHSQGAETSQWVDVAQRSSTQLKSVQALPGVGRRNAQCRLAWKRER